MKPLLVSLLLAAASAPALAACPSFPDDASTHYIENQEALMLCQQDEIATSAAARARELKLQADLQALQIELEQTLKLQQQLAAATAPALPQL